VSKKPPKCARYGSEIGYIELLGANSKAGSVVTIVTVAEKLWMDMQVSCKYGHL
jgi:hypothetical protein